MPGWLRSIPIEDVGVLAAVYVVAALLVVVLVLPRPGTAGRTRTRIGWTALAAGIGAAVGLVAVWQVVDVQDVFGVAASTVIRAAAAAGGAGVGVAVVNLVRTRWWRKALAVVAIPAVLAASAMMINRDVAYYPTLGDAFGDTGVGSLAFDEAAGQDRSLATWRPPADMPRTGTVGTEQIPGTVSHWHGRAAWVYLPPAARVAHPPRLPVVIAFSGEPGGPSDVFLAGGLQKTLDAIAAQHEGVAPVVVVPDQLGSYSANPMCLDSRLGNVATYVTVDVRHWILDHLPVAASRKEWTVAGFSEGGTCAVQFGTEHPGIFSSFIAVSPELAPFNRSVAHTIAVGFGGSRAAYEAAKPIAVMHRIGHYARTRAIYSVGGLDKRYGADAPQLAKASRSVGMDTSYRVFPALAHNWNTGSAGLSWGLQQLTSWWRLPA
ncbi:alpha/beta hydrolase [Amnibacterium endophyticum]|uniref:Alpha/beta hydrolase n=1 Tax=Amnibacterium endophyticum TaxID=2109337 RepID=A0ABW4LFT7_9MICO